MSDPICEAAEPAAHVPGVPPDAEEYSAPAETPATTRPTRPALIIVIAVLLCVVTQVLSGGLAMVVWNVVRGTHGMDAGIVPHRPSDIDPRAIVLGVYLTVGLGIISVIVAAKASGRPWRERLGMVHPLLPGRGWIAAVVATWFACNVGALLMDALQRLQLLPAIGSSRGWLMAGLSGGSVASRVAMVIGGSVGVGFSEEMLFRGYLQRGLLERWRPALALAVTAVLFALAHGDLAYAVFVLPMGIWLGWLAWRTRSILPGIVCHLCLNATMQSLGAFYPRPGAAMAPAAASKVMPGPLSVVGDVLALALALVLLWLAARSVEHAVVDAEDRAERKQARASPIAID